MRHPASKVSKLWAEKGVFSEDFLKFSKKAEMKNFENFLKYPTKNRYRAN
jgi:hypothetical protein